MSYLNGLFFQKDPERRDVRDRCRDAFFAEFGGDRLMDPFTCATSPQTQSRNVMELFQKALNLHTGDTSAIISLMETVSGLSLSGSSVDRGDLAHWHRRFGIEHLAGSHFNLGGEDSTHNG